MRVSKTFFILIFGLSQLIVLAQEPVYRHYTSQNGLPSSEVYDVLQSEEGYIWFATNYGVVRFDGLNFRVFDKQDGLPENAIFNMQKDDSGRIWFNTFNGSLAYWDGEKIQPYKNNNKISAYIQSMGLTTTVFVSYDIQPDGSLLFDLNGKGLHLINDAGTIQLKKQKEDAAFFDLILLPNGKVLFNSSSTITEPTIRLIQGDSIFQVTRLFDNSAYKNNNLFRATHRNGVVYFTYNNLLIRAKGNKSELVYRFKYRIVDVQFDKSGGMWIGTINGGAFHFKDSNFTVLPENYLNGNSISKIFFDHEEGIWLTSTNNGIFYYPSLNITKYDMESSGLPSNRINDIEIDPSGKIWLGLGRGQLVSINTDNTIKTYHIETDQEAFISKIKWNKPLNRLLIGTNIDLYYFENGSIKLHPNIFSNKIGGRKKFSAIKDIALNYHTGDFWLGKYTGITKLSSSGKVMYMSALESNFNERVEAIELDSNGTVWMGTLHGLWQFKNAKFTQLTSRYSLLSERITVIKSINDTIVMGTRGNGLLILTKGSMFQFTTANGLPGNSIDALTISPNLIIAGTNQGVFTINRKNMISDPKIRTITTSNGLSSNEITSLHLKENSILIGTSEGLNILDHTALMPRSNHFPLFFTKLTIDESPVNIENNLQIKFEINSIEIDYFAISFHNKGKIIYRHRLLGLHDEWFENQHTGAQYPYLPAGKYTFEVSAKNLNGEWNPNPITLSFEIIQPFWQTWWFYSLIAIMLVMIIYLVFRLRIKAIRNKNQLLLDIYRYQQEALIGQMNPHFIFNALNSLQRYILENDKVASNKYLSKFSGLMRKTLENSQNKEISIQAESDTLQLYLEVEASRFKNRFNFELIIGEGFDPKTTMIPVFIIQPLVENAIWHGLMNSEKLGLLQIQFTRSSNDLQCMIVDNGIGREAAAAISNRKDKKSLGISIIQNRIKLLNTQENREINIQYTDLKNESGMATGTEVIVSFPHYFIQKI